MTISALSAATTACETANWRLSDLELQKLLYLAHRTFMGRHRGDALINEAFQAWDRGPVVPELYHIVKVFGAGKIDMLPPVRRNLGKEEHEVIREVVDYYSDQTPGQLVELTHRPGGAWDRCYIPRVRNIVIPSKYIMEEYDQVVGSTT